LAQHLENIKLDDKFNITCTSERTTVNASCNPAESILIEVSNNGPAIPDEEAALIFTPPSLRPKKTEAESASP
jgi:signal transduction histidine kinase